MRTSFALMTASLLAGCATVPAAVTSTPLAAAPTAVFSQAPLDATITSALPRNARPLHYDITITPDAANLAFSGDSSVRIEVYSQTKTIVMHAHMLDITSASMAEDGGANSRTLDVAGYDEALQTVTLASDQTILPGTYVVSTAFDGTINQDPAGLFAVDYPDPRTGEEVRSLYTQFQAPDARRFAPMFDEPAYKATFDLTVIVPEDDMAISNMPATTVDSLGDGMQRITFDTTPVMSSYLLFFALGDFERNAMTIADGTELGIVSASGTSDQTQYILESTAELMPWFTEYFGVEYPLPKLDNVASPGFPGAMENWGAILSGESLLVGVPGEISGNAQQSMYFILAHEVAHQWFGNIVTMAWWDDLWLNEGFATWMHTKATARFNPEWDYDLNRIDTRENAMSPDARATTHPVVQEINTVAESQQAFDSITYNKGQALLAMFEAYAGEDVWRDGLRTYIARHSYENTTSSDLWQAMEEAGATGLSDIARDFTTKAGVPLLMADGSCTNGQTEIALSQGEFSVDRQDDVAANPQSWMLPVTIASASSRETLVLDASIQSVLPGCDAPVIMNAGQLGYYRTLYSDELSQRLTAGFATLEPIDQLGLLRDSTALAAANYQPMARPLALLEQVPVDAHPVVTELAIDTLVRMRGYLGEEHTAERAILAEMATERGLPRLIDLGFDPVAGESLLDTNLRSAMISTLSALESPTVVAEAGRRLAALAQDADAMDGPLRRMWLNAAAANATPSQWEMLVDIAANASAGREQASYYQLVGSVRDETLAKRALHLALSGDAGASSSGIIRAVSVRDPDLAFNFAMDNIEAVQELVPAAVWPRYVAFLALGAEDAATLERLEDYAEQLSDNEAGPIRRVLSRMANSDDADPRLEEEVLEWVRAREG